MVQAAAFCTRPKHPRRLSSTKETPIMPLHSTIDPKSPEFARNADVMRSLVAELRDKLKVVSGGG